MNLPEPGGLHAEGQFMHDLARRLWHIHRSITGDGVRQTLAVLKEYLPALTLHEIPTNTKVFDWTIPSEWVIRAARLEGPNGEVVADLQDNNLHVVGYSVGVDCYLDLADLQTHLHSIAEQPTAIPFVTSYYHPNWGFCLTHEERLSLEPGTYHAVIDAEHIQGSLTYGEVLIPGEVEDEIFLSTYVCHPSMANNELSGPVVATALARWIDSLPRRHYSYRIIFVPESIGAITYTSLHLEELRSRVLAGFQLTCIGDERAFTYLATRNGNTRIDRIAKRVLSTRDNVREYSYLHRGSDERTYCSAGVDLPVVSIMRSRYGDYSEYHTNLDDLDSVVTPAGLQGGFDAVRECIETLETEMVLIATHYGEPQLGRRGLYHSMLNKNTSGEVMLRTNILAYADGHHSIADIAKLTKESVEIIESLTRELELHDLVTLTRQSQSMRVG